MSAPAFRFIAVPEAIAAIQELAAGPEIKLSKPQPLDSTSEPLNAPISGDYVMHAAQVISIIFTSGTAALTFLDKLSDLVRKNKQPVLVRRSADDRSVMVTPETTPAAIKDTFSDV